MAGDEGGAQPLSSVRHPPKPTTTNLTPRRALLVLTLVVGAMAACSLVSLAASVSGSATFDGAASPAGMSNANGTVGPSGLAPVLAAETLPPPLLGGGPPGSRRTHARRFGAQHERPPHAMCTERSLARARAARALSRRPLHGDLRLPPRRQARGDSARASLDPASRG